LGRCFGKSSAFHVPGFAAVTSRINALVYSVVNQMQITVFGAGPVGLVTAACLSDIGNKVVCYDIDRPLVSALSRGRLKFHEPGLQEIIQRNLAAGRLSFVNEGTEAIGHSDVYMLAVNATPGASAKAVTKNLLAALNTICDGAETSKLVLVRTTVPVGTCDALQQHAVARLARRKAAFSVTVCPNPEFLREGSAVEDFLRPDRVIIGTVNGAVVRTVRTLYAAFLRQRDRLIAMDSRSAELTKLASNAMLASRVSFMNEIAEIADGCGADVEQVRCGMGLDSRIGPQFLHAGAGYGGSCLPKDLQILTEIARLSGVQTPLIDAIRTINDRRTGVILAKLERALGGKLEGRTIALWGLAFKPDTSDLRNAPGLQLAAELIRRGAGVVAYDPVARPILSIGAVSDRSLKVSRTAMGALIGADALIVVTEWKEFRSASLDALRRRLKGKVLLDARNIFDPEIIRSLGIGYVGIGRP